MVGINPTIQSLVANQYVNFKNLQLKWQDHKSPNYSGFEQGKRTFHLSSESEGKVDFSFAVINPTGSTTLFFGQDSRWSEVKDLNSGQYYISLRCEERSFFGDILVGRSVTAGVPFKIIE